ncbi:MAG: carbohydrate binding domain-containing protein [Thermoguttaceae bacterium]
MFHRLVLLGFFGLCCFGNVSNAILMGEDQMFPFVVSYNAPQNVTNMSSRLSAPAGKDGFIRVEKETFVNDKGEIRFWATNLSGAANFPTHEVADRIADRLAKFGFNCVRLHWIDAWDIFGGWNPKNHTDFDPDRIDKLDYLIAALKKRGIYVNINLHVSRKLDDRDGFPHADKRPEYDKGVGNFYPAMIEKQKEYAKMLLTHINPYTKLPYTDDPCVAMVEISNEDSIVVQWCNNWRGCPIDDLPDPYQAELRIQWNDWLRSQYKTTEALKKAWNFVDEPLGPEILVGGDFKTPFKIDGKTWYWQIDNIVDCSADVKNGFLEMDVRKMGGVSYVPQIGYRAFKIEKGKPYSLSFRMKSDQKVRLNMSVGMDHAPWTVLGISASIDLTPEWKTFSYQFIGTQTDEAARFCITGLQLGKYELTDVTLKTGGNFGFSPECTLKNGTIPCVLRSKVEKIPNATKDWCAFLIDIERKYWIGMYRFLKDELKVKAPISGTQLAYGSSHIQAALDYCDDHAYWNHPSWPEKQWDRKDWYVRNRALVNNAATDILPDLATRRVAGKPYTVSEYNHPYPNLFSSEGLPMMAAFGAFQRWSGIFQYTYAHKLESEPTLLTGYFDLDVHATQLVHAPVCAALFQSAIAPAKKEITYPMTLQDEIDILAAKLSPRFLGFLGLGVNPEVALLHATAVQMATNNTTNSAENSQNSSLLAPIKPSSQRVFRSDTGELIWDMSEEGAGYFTATSPEAKVFAGFPKNRTITMGNVTLKIGETLLDFATVSLLRQNETTYLLAATGAMYNKNGKPTERESKTLWDPKDAITLSDQWGEAPVMCEGIPLELTLPGGPWNVWPLDEAGNRRQTSPIQFAGDAIQLGPEHKTLWYEISVR